MEVARLKDYWKEQSKYEFLTATSEQQVSATSKVKEVHV